MPFATLLPLLTGGTLPRTLGDILTRLLGTGANPNLRGKIEDLLQDRLDEQQARTGARVLRRSVLELIDAAVENQSGGMTVDQRAQLGAELAKNAAVQLAQAADLLLKYPELQAAVVRAKEAGGAAATLQAAREARNEHAE
ncbi:MAG: hypothetical protein FJX77_14000, partial [Armatimonadetes bacterium]|nr:hypothetical protein [Armatimonadota bacterium]